MPAEPKSLKDFYGNTVDQLPTPTTMLLAKREAEAKIVSNEIKYTATLPNLTVKDIEHLVAVHNIEHMLKIFLKDQPPEKHFTFKLTIREDIPT